MSRAFKQVMRRVRKTETCWIFEGPIRSKSNPYGVVKVGGRNGKVCYCHRISYEYHKGPIPNSLLVMHTCNNTRCVNPEHLVAGSYSDNAKQAVRDGLTTLPHQKEGYINPRKGKSVKQYQIEMGLNEMGYPLLKNPVEGSGDAL